MDAKSTKGQDRPIEKRRKARRINMERREEIRFEPNSENRRKNLRRRSSDGDVWKPIKQ
jgi:hypothetical protein